MADAIVKPTSIQQEGSVETTPDLIRTQLLRIGDIAGMHYTKGRKTDTLIIYGIGAPIPPDNGTLPDAPIILKHDIDIYVPDYILGVALRFRTQVTPENCVKTFTDLYSAFTEGCIGRNSSRRINVPLQYKRIVFIGRSFGAIYVPLLPRFNSEITELAVFSPVLDPNTQGDTEGEESKDDFLRSMREDGYHHLYRGITNEAWRRHINRGDDLSPLDNLTHLRNARLFIAHGMKDPIIHPSKSSASLTRLLEEFPDKTDQFRLQFYPEGDHGKSTTNLKIEDFLKWLRL